MMSEDDWEVVDEAAGELQAELIRSLLESFGLKTWISQEGAGRVHGLSVGRLGRAQILVPSSQADEAKNILQKYYAGELALPDEEPDADEGREGPL